MTERAPRTGATGDRSATGESRVKRTASLLPGPRAPQERGSPILSPGWQATCTLPRDSSRAGQLPLRTRACRDAYVVTAGQATPVGQRRAQILMCCCFASDEQPPVLTFTTDESRLPVDPQHCGLLRCPGTICLPPAASDRPHRQRAHAVLPERRPAGSLALATLHASLQSLHLCEFLQFQPGSVRACPLIRSRTDQQSARSVSRSLALQRKRCVHLSGIPLFLHIV